MKKSEIVVGKTYARVGVRGEIRRKVVGQGSPYEISRWGWGCNDQDWVLYLSKGETHACTHAAFAAWARYEIPEPLARG